MQKLLEQIEQAGFYAWSDASMDLSAPLSEHLDWLLLKERIAEVIAYAVEADKVCKLIEEQRA